MSEYTPVTVEEWREFVTRNQGDGGSLCKAYSKMLGKEFDRTIAEVKAEAWNEGWMHDADYMNTWGQFCPHEKCNPYREETE